MNIKIADKKKGVQYLNNAPIAIGWLGEYKSGYLSNFFQFCELTEPTSQIDAKSK